MYNLETITEIQCELTTHCNAKCPQCGRFDIFGEVLNDLSLQHIDLDIIEKLPIEKMLNLETIVFNGNYGEPFMHPGIDTILKKFRNKKIRISTNGSIRSIKWWKELAKFNTTVTFGIDGLEDTHHLYRRNTDFNKILKNAKSYIDNGGDARWQYIVFKHNQHQMKEAKKLSENLGFKSIFFRYSDRFLKNDEYNVYENKKKIYTLEPATEQKTIHNLSGSDPNTFYTKKLFKLDSVDKNIECPWAKNKKIFISTAGLVFPCCHMVNVTAGKPIYKKLYEKIVGSYQNISLQHHSFEKIIGSEIFQKLLPDSIKNKPHPNCIEHCSPVLSKNKIKSDELDVLNN